MLMPCNKASAVVVVVVVAVVVVEGKWMKHNAKQSSVTVKARIYDL